MVMPGLSEEVQIQTEAEAENVQKSSSTCDNEINGDQGCCVTTTRFKEEKSSDLMRPTEASSSDKRVRITVSACS
jgi:hypothetical protein